MRPKLKADEGSRAGEQDGKLRRVEKAFLCALELGEVGLGFGVVASGLEDLRESRMTLGQKAFSTAASQQTEASTQKSGRPAKEKRKRGNVQP